MYTQQQVGWGPGPDNFNNGMGEGWGGHVLPLWIGLLAPLLILVVLWSLFWKGLALWHSARRAHPWWFVIMLVVNTLGILEIIYLFGVAKLSLSQLFSKHAPHEH